MLKELSIRFQNINRKRKSFFKQKIYKFKKSDFPFFKHYDDITR